MQYDRQEDGTLVPLPKPSIDTGLGLERMATILQGVASNFETDMLRSLMAEAEAITGVAYGGGDKSDTSLRILADHSRAVTFMISDGILPSNEGRGYVLRRLLRRAVRHGRLLGVDDPFLTRLIDVVVRLMGDAYPEIVEHHDLVRRIVIAEEERFGHTLRQGLAYLESAIERARAVGTDHIDGVEAFTLHDTFGFPLELTSEIAAEAGISVDTGAFDAEMEAQRARGRAAVKDESWATYGGVYSELARELGALEFCGYEKDDVQAKVVAIIVDGARVDEAPEGTRLEVVLDTTPFYGEQGGQLGDHGTLTADGVAVNVEDTKLPQAGLTVHVGVVSEGTLQLGSAVHAAIDVMRRERIRRNHTATHLLHWALRVIVGEHAKQAGSLVAPERFRFDFTHFEAVTAEQLERIERMVNAKIFENHPVRAYETSIATARESGVTALFGEKYGDYVRVLEVGNFSKELCGGTHVGRTSEIGFMKLTSEGSVGANLRRIEAVTSFDAYELTFAEQAQLRAAADALRATPRDVADKVAALAKRVRELESTAHRMTTQPAGGDVDALLASIVDLGYKAVVARLDVGSPEGLRATWDALRGRGIDAVVLAAVDAESGKPILLSAGSPEAAGAGFDAGAMVRTMAPYVSGRGGGKREMAQGGGDSAAGIDDALSAAREALGAG
jgi:alanyl-tRNA synthetase